MPCLLLAWTRKPQKAEPKTRVFVQVVYFGKSFQGTGVGGLREIKQKLKKPIQGHIVKLVTTMDRGLKPAGTLCGVVQDVLQSGPAEVWERELLSGSVTNLRPSHVVRASE